VQLVKHCTQLFYFVIRILLHNTIQNYIIAWKGGVQMNGAFGERMKRIREEKNLTLEEVALKIGLSKGTVSRYENGEIDNIPLSRVEDIANLFKVSPEWLIGWSEERYREDEDNDDLKYIKVMQSAKKSGIKPERLAALIGFLSKE
jgi:transcriptional regulator with XRE-family HTH domain